MSKSAQIKLSLLLLLIEGLKIKSKDDADYMLKVRGGSKKLTEKKGLKECKKTGNTGCYVHYSNKAAFGQ